MEVHIAFRKKLRKCKHTTTLNFIVSQVKLTRSKGDVWAMTPPRDANPSQERRHQAPLERKEAKDAPKRTIKSTVVSFETRNEQACETSKGSLK